MNTNLQNKTFEECRSLEVQDSNLKVNRNGSDATSAFMVNGNMPQSQREISRENAAPKESSKPLAKSTKTNNTTPRLQVTVEFAAKQLFQILLVDIKRRNAKFDSILEPLPGAICV